jgi:integrase
VRSSYASRPAWDDTPQDGASLHSVAPEPKVYWNARHRVFFGKYKHGGRWKNKVVPVSIDDREKATLWFAAWLRRLGETGVEPVNGEVQVSERKTVRSLADRWLKWKKEQAGDDAKAFKGSKRLLDRWVFPHAIADADIEHELDIGHCTDWIEWVKRSGRAPLTVRNIVQGLRGFLVDVRGKGWVRLRENPLLDPYIRKVIGGTDTLAGRNTIIHLKKDEAQRLIASDSPHILQVRRVRTLFAVATGCRMGEIAALRFEDIDLGARVPTARVFRQVQKSGRNGALLFKEPKKKSHRILPLHPTLAAALRWWKGTRPADRVVTT